MEFCSIFDLIQPLPDELWKLVVSCRGWGVEPICLDYTADDLAPLLGSAFALLSVVELLNVASVAYYSLGDYLDYRPSDWRPWFATVALVAFFIFAPFSPMALRILMKVVHRMNVMLVSFYLHQRAPWIWRMLVGIWTASMVADLVG